LPAQQLRWVGNALRKETTGGVLLLVAAVAALIWANLDFSSYNQLRDYTFGPAELHLDLSLGKWAADGLLAIFFFVAGMELKHELAVGSLRDRSVAAVPIAAALGGMIVPALIFFALNAGQPTASGWGIPMATDIAFALAVLAVAGKSLPIELRAFLLTLAVVDDLGALGQAVTHSDPCLHVQRSRCTHSTHQGSLQSVDAVQVALVHDLAGLCQ
jgi:NhaA family Na+:H+ antiporter